jgi:hypothetical protein
MLVTVSVKRLRVHAPAWMFVTGVHLVSRLTTNWFKDATGRLRPAEWLKQRTDETFGWEGGISFPSGHVVLFASLVIPLAVLYPRLRPLLAIAVFAALARIAVNAHFVSDAIGRSRWWPVDVGGGWFVRPYRRRMVPATISPAPAGERRRCIVEQHGLPDHREITCGSRPTSRGPHVRS